MKTTAWILLCLIALSGCARMTVQPPDDDCPVPSVHPVCTKDEVVVPCHEKGDVNGNAEVNPGDLVILQQIVLGIKCPDIHSPFGDMNGDGQLNTADILLLEKALLGL